MKLNNSILLTLLRYNDIATVQRILKITSIDKKTSLVSLKQNLWIQGMVGDLELSLEGFIRLSDNYGTVLLSLENTIAFPQYIKSFISSISYLWVLTYNSILYCRLNNTWVKVMENVARIRSRKDNSIYILENLNGVSDYSSYFIHIIKGDKNHLKKVNTTTFIDIVQVSPNDHLLITDSHDFMKVRPIQHNNYIITSLEDGKFPSSFLGYKLSFGRYKIKQKNDLILTTAFKEIPFTNDFLDYEIERFSDNVSEYENSTYFGEGIDV